MIKRILLQIIFLFTIGGWCLLEGVCQVPQVPMSETDDAVAGIRLRRLYVPEKYLEQLLTSEHMTVGREDFEEVLSSFLDSSKPHLNINTSVHLLRSTYFARFDGQSLVDGKAQLEFELKGPQALYRLEPLGLAIQQPQWQGTPRQSAVLGVGPLGGIMLQIPRTATLEFDWSLFGEGGDDGQRRFQLMTPLSPRVEWNLAIPNESRPVVEDGIVERLTSGGERLDIDIDLQNEESLWRIRRRSNGTTQLTVRAVDGPSAAQFNFVRTSTTYDIEETGVDLSVELMLDVMRPPLKQVELTVPAELQLISAKVLDSEVAWRLRDVQSALERSYVLTFPEPLTGTANVVVLSARANVVTGEPWQLPRLQVKGAYWREGVAMVRIADSLSLSYLESDPRARLLDSVIGADVGKTYRFKMRSPASSISLVVNEQSVTTALMRGTTIEFLRSTTRAEVALGLTATGSERFTVDASVTEGWFVDSVDSDPPDTLESFEYDYSERLPGTNRRRLHLRFVDPLTADRPIRIRVQARRLQTGLRRRIQGQELPLIDVPGAEVLADVVALQLDGSAEFVFSGDPGLVRLDPAALTKMQRDLLATQGADAVFFAGNEITSLDVQTREVQSRYVADAAIQAIVRDGQIEETYSVGVEPSTTAVSRVLVHLSRPSEAVIKWRLIGDENGILAARVVDLPEFDSGVEQGGELWELILRSQQSDRFEINGVRSTPFVQGVSVSLASFPESSSQSGTLILRTFPDHLLAPKIKGLKSISAEPELLDEPGILVGCYRYEPLDSPRCELQIRDEATELTRAWAWSVHAKTLCAFVGETRHELTFYLENHGLSELQIDLPAGAHLDGIRMNGRVLAKSLLLDLRKRGGRDRLRIPLVSTSRFPVVVVAYTTPEISFDFWGQVSFPTINTNIDILETRWDLWMPSGVRPAFSNNVAIATRRATDVGWSERLFGPLLRKKSGRAMVAADLSQIASLGKSPSIPPIARACMRGIGASILGLRNAGSDQNNWTQLLTAVADEISDQQMSERVLIEIDARAFTEMGITPQSAVVSENVWEVSSLANAEKLLAHNRLCLLVRKNRVLLTTDVGIVLRGEEVKPTSNAVVFLERTHLIAETEEVHFAVTLASWLKGMNPKPLPWKASSPVLTDGLVNAGWYVHRTTFDEADPPIVSVYKPARIISLGWALFLIGVLGLNWSLFHRRRVGICFIGLVIGVALLAPAEFVPATSLAFLGCCLGVVSAVFCRRKPTLELSRRRVETTAVRPYGETFSCLLVAFGMPICSVEAQEPTVFNVVVPVDDAQQPTGRHVFVPESLYIDLLKQTKNRKKTPSDWVVKEADYRVHALQAGDQERLEIDQIEASLEIETFVNNTEIRLPFKRAEVRVISAFLDGLSILQELDQYEDSVQLSVPERGSYSLEFNFQVTVRQFVDSSGINVSIPPVPVSKVNILAPVDGPLVRVSSARGIVREVADGHRIVELGGVEQLSLRWRDSPQTITPTEAPLMADQLLWLRIQPDSIFCEVKHEFTQAGGRRQEIRLSGSQALKAMPSKEPLNWIDKPSGETMFSVESKFGGTDSFLHQGLFFLGNTVNAERVEVPRISIDQGQIRRRWLAISRSPEVQVTAGALSALPKIPREDFVAAWFNENERTQEDLELPEWSYRIPDGVADLSFLTQLIVPKPQVVEEQAVIFREDFVELHYQADVNLIEGSLGQYGFQVPINFALDNVVATSGELSLQVEVLNDGKGQLTLLFDKHITGNHQFVMSGKIPARSTVTQKLPTVRLLGAATSNFHVEAYRDESMMVEVVSRDGFVVDKEQSFQEVSPHIRLVGAFSQSETQSAADSEIYLRVSRNLSDCVNTVIAEMSREESDWKATIVHDFEVSQGLLDVVYYELPGELTEILQIVPEHSFRVTAIPGSDQRRLTVWLNEPVSGRDAIHILAVWKTNPDQRNIAPEIRVLNGRTVNYFVRLPAHVSQTNQIIEKRGLQASPLPDRLLGTFSNPDFDTFRRIRSPCFAAVKTLVRTEDGSQIELADFQMNLVGDGHAYGVASFDVRSTGKPTCSVTVPERCRLVRAEVDGVDAVRAVSPNGQWTLGLGPMDLSHRISLVFRSTATKLENRNLKFSVPTIEDMPKLRTVVSVVRSNFNSSWEISEVGQMITSEAMERLRSQSVLEMLLQSVDHAREKPIREKEAWYRRWWQRSLRHDLQPNTIEQDLVQQSENDPSVKLSEFGEMRLEVAERLELSNVSENTSWQESPGSEVDGIANMIFSTRRVIGSYDSVDSKGMLKLRERFAEQQSVVGLLTRLGIVSLLTWTILWLNKKPALINLLREHPFVLGLGMGVAWLMFFTPALFGWLLLGCSILGVCSQIVRHQIVSRVSS